MEGRATVSARLGLLRNAPMTRPYAMPFAVAVGHPLPVKSDGLATSALLPLYPRKPTFIVRRSMSQKCHVWTAPAVQEESDISAKRSGAAMYPAFECSRYGRWP
jgi:hypothetical protein